MSIRPGTRKVLVMTHRYASLFLAAFWLLQVLSGILLVYARELDDWMLDASGQPTLHAAIEDAMREIDARGVRPLEYFISGGLDGQVDILTDPGTGDLDVWRVSGTDGQVQRVTAWTGPWWRLSLARGLLVFHKSLLAGPVGRIAVIISGLLLLITLLVGLKLAWPVKRRWRAALLPQPVPNPVARWFGWHRAAGLWVFPFVLLMVVTGLGLQFLPALERLTDSRATPPAPCTAMTAEAGPVSAAGAVDSARRRFPGADIVVVSLPGATRCYHVQMRQPGEWRRVFGTTHVYVDAASFDVVGVQDALQTALPARFVVALYTLHAGEWAGSAGRILTLLLGMVFLAVMGMGLWLWWCRRAVQARGRRSRTTS